MNSKTLTIFISSTFSDLQKHREVVHSAIRRLQNHAEDMIYWSADERTAAAASVDKVAQSDLMILILAHLYGSVESNSSQSFVELEYEAAKEKKIPVLAFFVEPTHPWSPNDIELDPEHRNRLESFKRKVEAECVRQFFTTPESLAMAVTQSIANFDRRRSTAPEDINLAPPIYREVVQKRSDLVHLADLDLLIGAAEDGLPLVLRVIRSQEIKKPLEKLAESLNIGVEQMPISGISNILQKEGALIWKETGVNTVTLPSGIKSRCYISYENLSDFFAPSLVSRLLMAANHGRATAIKQSSRLHSYVDTSSSMIAATSARYGRDKRVQSSGGANRFLALPTDSEEVYVVGWNPVTGGQAGVKFWRPFVAESILGLPEWTFELIETHSYDSSRIVAVGDSRTYYEKVSRVLERPKYFDNINYKTRIQISRRALSQMILMAAEDLKSLHTSGQIHGDIKPHNMLLSKEGVVLIDSFALNEGEVSPGLSPDWAAPEQLLTRPVSKSSDIFPLGLMLSAVIGAELTGEYIQYMLPSPDDEPLIVPILRDPILFLPLKEKTLTFAGRKAWFDFIETCLRYDSSQRPSDADAFIIALKGLSADYPLEGEVVFEIKSTLLPDLALFPDGSKAPCRVIADRWTSLRRKRVNQW